MSVLSSSSAGTMSRTGAAALNSFGLFCSYAVALLSGFVLTASIFMQSLSTARLSLALSALLFFHVIRFARIFASREVTLYAAFGLYMLFLLIWTPDMRQSMNTIVPALNCILTMILFGSLVVYHDTHTVLAGIFSGFLAGIVTYTLTSGFPFNYPADFSYNAIASMYLFGLVITLLLGLYSRHNFVFIAIALVLLLHILATTSIKTNLGIVIGALAAATVYSRELARYVYRHMLLLTSLIAVLVYTLFTNVALMDALQRGIDRVMIGIAVLQTRGDVPGYSALARRNEWQADGLDGWIQNPVFGYGAEAFRTHFGITSHSTPIDLLYNFGLIGLFLFYAIFVSVFLRLRSGHGRRNDDRGWLLIAALVCYLFVSLSGIVHYSVFVAAVISIGVALQSSSDVVTTQFGRTPSSKAQ